MDVPGQTSSSSLPFRSKKALRSNSKSVLEDQQVQPLSSKTPEKAAALPSRSRNRKVVHSIKGVRQAAESVLGSNRQQQHQLLDRTTEGSKSVKRKLDSLQSRSSSCRSKDSAAKPKILSDKFEILSKFFDSLDSAMRLLRFKGVASNFSNVCPKIEVLTDRRFSYSHLAQLKFILPEAIELKKVHIVDERSSCLKPDLHISFNFSVLDNQDGLDSGDRNMQLRKLFKARLSEFVDSHPEIDDVPKDLLPMPFNSPNQDIFVQTKTPATSSTNVTEEIPFNYRSEESQGFRIIKSMVPMTTTTSCKQKEFIGASHFSQSLSGRFSKKGVFRETESTNLATKLCDQSSSHSDVETIIDTSICNAVSSSKPCSPFKLPSNPTCNSSCLDNYASPIRSSSMPLPTTPSNMVDRVNMTEGDVVSAKTNDINSTPAKLVSTPVRLMASTPAIRPPKRSSMSPDDDSSFSTIKLIRRPPRSRSLIFDTPSKEDKNEDEIDDTSRASFGDDLLGVLPLSLLQSIREKEMKAKEEQSPAISQAKRRKKMIANLPKLFDAIFFLFHKRTVITKEELIYKLVVGNAEIVDKREIVEQLDLLQELVPEWISEKLASSDDVLVCIEKLSSASTVRARLEEAK